MLLSSGKSCFNCHARRAKCDGARPTCKRCTRAGVECIGYPTVRNPAHSASESRSRNTRGLVRAVPPVANSSYRFDGPLPLATGELDLGPITDRISSTQPETIISLLPTQGSSSASTTVATTGVPALFSETWSDPFVGHSKAPVEKSSATSGIGVSQDDSCFWLASGRPTTPPYEATDPAQTDLVPSPTSQSRGLKPMTSSQASLFDALFSLAHPVDEHYHISTGISQPSQSLDETDAPGRRDVEQRFAGENGSDQRDTEGVRAIMLKGLALDRNVKSNSLPFVLECYALWVSRMTFEPLRVTTVGREYVLRHYARSDLVRQKLTLLSKFGRSVAWNTTYNVDDLPTLPVFRNLMTHGYTLAESTKSPVRGQDAINASGAFDYTYELISISFKVLPLSTVLLTMKTAAPVFRRACPDPLEELAHLPSLLLNLDISLRYYCSLDVLLSVVTNRPMFFRYNVDFNAKVTESMLYIENFLGVQWLYGIPDRLVVTLARINAIREDLGICIDQNLVSELEMEIGSFQPILGVSASTDPVLNVARLMVQECWRQAAYIYLYMGLCGTDIEDARVKKAHNRFMKVFKGTKPARHPDVFLILPIVMLGITTKNKEDQELIKQRMFNLPECSRPRTVGNEILQILDVIWTQTGTLGRPAVWSDLRLACLRVTGM